MKLVPRFRERRLMGIHLVRKDSVHPHVVELA